MTLSPSIGFRRVVLAPSGRVFSKSRLLCPENFQLTELPAEATQTRRGLPSTTLAVLVHETAPIVFTITARLAPHEGTVSQWLSSHCQDDGYEAGTMTTVNIGSSPAVSCNPTWISNGETLCVCRALLEDGGQLFELTATAPAEIWAEAAESIEAMMTSFQLAEQRGAQAALYPNSPSIPTPLTFDAAVIALRRGWRPARSGVPTAA